MWSNIWGAREARLVGVSLIGLWLLLALTMAATAQPRSDTFAPTPVAPAPSAGSSSGSAATSDDLWRQALERAAGGETTKPNAPATGEMLQRTISEEPRSQSGTANKQRRAAAPRFDAMPYSGGDTDLRAGDVLRLHLPGEENLTGDFPIDRFGRVELPEIGTMRVAGKSLDDATADFRELLSAYFRDLDALQVTLAERRLLITVAGHVKKPGLLDLPADANFESAIVAAGGMKNGAQLDKLHVRRGTERLPVDYRSFLDTGNRELLPILEPLDEIFVPISEFASNIEIEFGDELIQSSNVSEDEEEAVSVFGEVHNPGRFPMKEGGSSFLDYLLRAGGPTMFAGVDSIRVLSAGKEPQRFNLTDYLDTGNNGSLPEMVPGTTIFVPRAKEGVTKTPATVYIMGEVKAPGAYEINDELTFMDVLANAGGPTRFAETRRLRVIKLDGSIVPFDLVAFTEGIGETVLPPITGGDAIFVPEKANQVTPSWLKVAPHQAIFLLGAVDKPGRYEWSDEMSLLDLLAHGNGPTAKADVANITIVPGGEDKGQPPLSFDLDAYLKDPKSEPVPELHAQYTVMVPALPDDPHDNKAQWVRQAAEDSIYVMGSINSPGRYGFNTSQGFLDILTAADGPSSSADLRSIQITHRDKDGAERVETFDMTAYLEVGDDSLLPQVVPGDVIYIPRQAAPFRGLNVIGAVAGPGRYGWSEKLTVMEILAAAGGPSKRADLSRVVIAPAQDAEGRVTEVYNLEAAFQVGAKPEGLPKLHRGDTIMVSELPDDPHDNKSQWVKQSPDVSIYVLGAVNAPGRYGFNTSQGFLDILAAADGPSSSADLRNIQITHRDRTTNRVETFSLADYLESGVDADLPEVVPGDVIFIPRESVPFRGVSIVGSISSPGRYEWAKGMTLAELVAEAGGPNKRADLSQVVISPPDTQIENRESEVFNLEAYWRHNEGKMPVLERGATVLISQLPDDPHDNMAQWVRQPPESSIYIMGQINAPGRYMFTDEMGILDILGAADGPTSRADLSRLFIVHRGNSGTGVEQFNFLDYIENGREEDLPKVARGDMIYIRAKVGVDRRIGIIGEVRSPGEYEWHPEMSLVGLIEKSGGPRENGDIANIKITPGGEDAGLPPMQFDLQEYYEKGDLGKQPRLKAGYSIMVPALPDDDDDDSNKASWIKLPSNESIYVMGAVRAPGRYKFTDEMHFLDILSAAEGPTSSADLHNIRITSRNKRAASVAGLNLALYFETGDEHLIPDVLPGDVIYVPQRGRQWLDESKETTVRVIGAVGSPGRYRFDDDMTILDLIAEAGGPSGSADVHRISIINLSCCEDRARSFDLARFASTGDFGSLPLLRQGDTIYVPFDEGGPIDEVTDRVSGLLPLITLLALFL